MKARKQTVNAVPQNIFEDSIEIPAKDKNEAKIKAEALSVLAANLSAQNLVLLAKKSSKKGINEKIQQFKNFI